MIADWRPAYHALQASGLKGWDLFSLRLPIGRTRRVQAALRRRSALLKARNDVMDIVFRRQGRLAPLGLESVAQVETTLHDPEQRRLLAALGLNREMLEAELREHHGTETSEALEEALQDLVAAGVLLRVPGKLLLASSDIFLAVHARRREPYNVGLLTRLLREGRDHERELRSRQERGTSTDTGRTYRL